MTSHSRDEESDRDTSSLACAPSPPPEILNPGRTVGDRYEILRLLGRGGMGVVYKARDLLLGDVVALKVLRSNAVSPGDFARFRDEIRLARRVSHPNVCRTHEYGEAQGLRFISMAFIDGIDLKRLLRYRGPLPPAEAFEVALATAAGLQAVHDEGIVHRDLKAANLMRDREGVIRLMDFGLARDATAHGTRATGPIVGTPDYMSPEQAAARRLDYRSDLYAFGVVLYELFTASRPFQAGTAIAVMRQHMHDPLRLDTAEAARIPAPVRPVLLRALAKRPDDRFPSAAAMANAIRKARDACAPRLRAWLRSSRRALSSRP